MNQTQARALVVAALTDVASELDADGIDPHASLRDGADLDSMDFQAFVAAVSEAIGVDIPEADYRQLDGLAKAIEYVVSRG